MECNPFPHLDLSCLTARQRAVVEMRYDCCLSWAEISLFTERSIRSVRDMHDRAIVRLREANTHSADYKVDA